MCSDVISAVNKCMIIIALREISFPTSLLRLFVIKYPCWIASVSSAGESCGCYGRVVYATGFRSRPPCSLPVIEDVFPRKAQFGASMNVFFPKISSTWMVAETAWLDAAWGLIRENLQRLNIRLMPVVMWLLLKSNMDC